MLLLPAVLFSIVTPSLSQLPWLRRCARSVADQRGVSVEHLVQDGGTGPAIDEWARTWPNVSLSVQPDEGMYDAINKALKRASGEICGILNCDEQYLPGTLARVERAFSEHPDAHLVAGDFLVVDPQQQLLAFRKVTPLRPEMILTDHLYAFTCALFFRRSILEKGFWFDASLKDVADGEWVARVLQAGHRAALVPEFLSTFTFTGANRSLGDIARLEKRAVQKNLPAAMRLTAPLLRLWRRGEKFLRGGYSRRPITYQVYVGEEDEARTTIRCERPGWRYPG